MTTPAFEAFKTKFKVCELTVRQYQHWTWSVRPAQGTLGASVISLNRAATAWGEVSAEENAELAVVVREVESGLHALTEYEKINYLMLMMVDDHVHFHVFPRYSQAREFANRTWNDQTWPKPPDLLAGSTESDVLAEIVKRLRT